jgi:transcriptional regulator with XRE-family HTH domain
VTSRVDLRRSAVRGEQAEQSSRELVAELVRRRQDAGLTQSDVAERIGTSQSTVAKLETHTHDPKLTTLVRWARAVGVDLAVQVSWHEGTEEESGKA